MPASSKTAQKYGGTSVGDLENGVWNGQGTARYATDEVYIGDFIDRKRHGQRAFTRTDGFTDEGERQNGQTSSKGVAVYPNGVRLEGAFRDVEFVGWTRDRNSCKHEPEYHSKIPL